MIKENTTRKDRREYIKRYNFNTATNNCLGEIYDMLNKVGTDSKEERDKKRALRVELQRFKKANHENRVRLYKLYEVLTGENLWSMGPEKATVKREELDKFLIIYEHEEWRKMAEEKDGLFTNGERIDQWLNQYYNDTTVYDMVEQYKLEGFFHWV